MQHLESFKKFNLSQKEQAIEESWLSDFWNKIVDVWNNFSPSKAIEVVKNFLLNRERNIESELEKTPREHSQKIQDYMIQTFGNDQVELSIDNAKKITSSLGLEDIDHKDDSESIANKICQRIKESTGVDVSSYLNKTLSDFLGIVTKPVSPVNEGYWVHVVVEFILVFLVGLFLIWLFNRIVWKRSEDDMDSYIAKSKKASYRNAASRPLSSSEFKKKK